jgi:hypothetical protein
MLLAGSASTTARECDPCAAKEPHQEQQRVNPLNIVQREERLVH